MFPKVLDSSCLVCLPFCPWQHAISPSVPFQLHLPPSLVSHSRLLCSLKSPMLNLSPALLFSLKLSIPAFPSNLSKPVSLKLNLLRIQRLNT